MNLFIATLPLFKMASFRNMIFNSLLMPDLDKVVLFPWKCQNLEPGDLIPNSGIILKYVFASFLLPTLLNFFLIHCQSLL
jgi:hypothetical protein